MKTQLEQAIQIPELEWSIETLEKFQANITSKGSSPASIVFDIGTFLRVDLDLIIENLQQVKTTLAATGVESNELINISRLL